MKARLVGLLFLCCGFLFALSLMVVSDAPPRPEPAHGYIQSMALPPPAASQPEGPGASKPLAEDKQISFLVYSGDEPVSSVILPRQRQPYYEQAYYAFYFPDEAG